MKSPMSSKQIQPDAASNAVDLGLPFVREELPRLRRHIISSEAPSS